MTTDKIITGMRWKNNDVTTIIKSTMMKSAIILAVTIQWTGLLDWTTGLTFDLNFKVAVDSKAPQFVGEG